MNVAVTVDDPAALTVALDPKIDKTDVSDDEYVYEPVSAPATPVAVGAVIVYGKSPYVLDTPAHASVGVAFVTVIAPATGVKE